MKKIKRRSIEELIISTFCNSLTEEEIKYATYIETKNKEYSRTAFDRYETFTYYNTKLKPLLTKASPYINKINNIDNIIKQKYSFYFGNFHEEAKTLKQEYLNNGRKDAITKYIDMIKVEIELSTKISSDNLISDIISSIANKNTEVNESEMNLLFNEISLSLKSFNNNEYNKQKELINGIVNILKQSSIKLPNTLMLWRKFNKYITIPKELQMEYHYLFNIDEPCIYEIKHFSNLFPQHLLLIYIVVEYNINIDYYNIKKIPPNTVVPENFCELQLSKKQIFKDQSLENIYYTDNTITTLKEDVINILKEIFLNSEIPIKYYCESLSNEQCFLPKYCEYIQNIFENKSYLNLTELLNKIIYFSKNLQQHMFLNLIIGIGTDNNNKIIFTKTSLINPYIELPPEDDDIKELSVLNTFEEDKTNLISNYMPVLNIHH